MSQSVCGGVVPHKIDLRWCGGGLTLCTALSKRGIPDPKPTDPVVYLQQGVAVFRVSEGGERTSNLANDRCSKKKNTFL